MGLTDPTQWAASATDLTLIDFEVNDPKGKATIDNAQTSYAEEGNNATFQGVTFSGSGSASLFATDPKYISNIHSWNSGDVLSDEGADGLITVELLTGVTAFGVDLGTFDPSKSIVEVSVTTLDQTQSFIVVTDKRPHWSFFGVLSDQAILSVTLDAVSSSNLVIDNFSFGSYSAAPEPPPVDNFVVGGQGGTTGPAGVDEPAVPAMVLLGLAVFHRVSRSRRRLLA